MDKIKVLLHSLWYPFTLTTYFKKALERRDDIELKLVGVSTGAYQPYNNGMQMPLKYVVNPDIPLPYSITPDLKVDYNLVKAHLGGWKPDLIITGDAGVNWFEKPSDGYVVTVGTDPHVINYNHARLVSDKFFNMQEVYSKPGDYYLPYAYDPEYHCDLGQEREYDVAMIGLQYNERVQIANELRNRGLKVLFSTGEVLDEYRKLNNKAKVGVNWASLDDLNARAFEIPMMGQIEVMKTVTDMKRMRHIYFRNTYNSTSIQEIIRLTISVLDNYSNEKEILKVMRKEMRNETYDNRVTELLKESGF